MDSLKSFETYLITEKQISEKVARNYCYSVKRFLEWTSTEDLGKHHATQYYRHLQNNGYSSSTVANIIFALNHFFHFLGKNIRLTPPKQHTRQPAFLTIEEAQTLVKVVPNARDKAIVMTLLYTGMRVSELCHLDISDLNLDYNEIMVKDTKNYDDRKVILSEKCVCVLQEYLATVQNYEGDAVFISRKGRKISRNRVYALVKKYGRLAGIKKKVTPHVLRHTFATTMIGNGASVFEVKQQLGHRSLESTLRYVHLQTEERKKLYMAHCPQF
jgi:integrase/recombinase XerD